MRLIVLGSCAVSFLASYLLLPLWIRTAHRRGITGFDMNKRNKPSVAESGGIVTITGAILGMALYVMGTRLVHGSPVGTREVLAVMATVLLAGLLGVIDDLKGWKKGFKPAAKLLLTVPAAIPLALISAERTSLILPLAGRLELGFLIPFLVVPLAVVGAATGFNLVAGYNGLEAGLGMIILGCLALLSWRGGPSSASVVAACMFFSLLAFFLRNKVPAKVFPGDSLTYSTGAAIACSAVLGRLEAIGFLLFLPHVFDAVMVVKYSLIEHKTGIEAFAKVTGDGSLDMPYNKIYGFEHLGLWLAKRIKSKVTEGDVVKTILGIESLLALIILGLRLLGVL